MHRNVLRLGLLAVLVGLGAAALFAAPALAQTADPGSMLDASFAGIAIEAVVVVFGPILLGLGSLLLARLYALAGLRQTAENRATIEQVLARAASFARAHYQVPYGPLPRGVREGAFNLAAGYALEAGPKAFAREGIKDTGSDRLRRMLEVRFSDPGFAVLGEAVSATDTAKASAG